MKKMTIALLAATAITAFGGSAMAAAPYTIGVSNTVQGNGLKGFLAHMSTPTWN